jgi:nudix-type nucleoside diphosphatase (YffH/AdpP family)
VHAKRVNIIEKRRLLDDFFKVDEVRLTHERFDGSMSEEQRRLVFERGDAAAGLLVDPDRRKVILINQFRLPTRDKIAGGGWILETAAGMIRDGETPEACLIREVYEETGYQLTKADPVATFYASPGGSTERIFLYCADIRRTDKTGAGGGTPRDGEDIELVEIDLEDFFARLAAREFADAKIIIAGQWLRDRRAKMPAEADPDKSRTYSFSLDGNDKIIGIKTGNILAVHDVEVWANSENTDMMMDRFFGRSVSATIRSFGAKKHENGVSIERDTIGEELQAEMGRRRFVMPGTVLQTSAGELARRNSVKRIFHVASVQGCIGTGLSTTLDTLETCVDNLLVAASDGKYRSILVPMLASGQGGFLVRDVAPRLVSRAVAYFQKNPKSRLCEIYFLAYSIGDKELLEDAMLKTPALKQVVA